MSTSEYKVVGGYYTAGQTPQINAVVNAAIAAGWTPYGSPMLRSSGWVDQPLIKGTSGTITEYRVVTGYSDNRTPKIAALVGWNPLGDTVRLDTAYFLQAYVLGQPYGDVDPQSIAGITPMGIDLLTSDEIDVAYLSPSTAFGRALLNLPDAAALKALIPPVNETFRASFTTTSTELTQFCAVNNVPQAVTFNAQAIPNATLGTLNNATGVFTAAKAISGVLAISCQVRRTLGGASPVNWGIQVETSPDGVVWAAVAGSSRRINLRGGGDNNILQMLGFVSAISLPAGTRLRFTQSCDTASSNTGLIAGATLLGETTAAGIIFSLYMVD